MEIFVLVFLIALPFYGYTSVARCVMCARTMIFTVYKVLILGPVFRVINVFDSTHTTSGRFCSMCYALQWINYVVVFLHPAVGITCNI